jgi:hypothetical protein
MAPGGQVKNQIGPKFGLQTDYGQHVIVRARTWAKNLLGILMKHKDYPVIQLWCTVANIYIYHNMHDIVSLNILL